MRNVYKEYNYDWRVSSIFDLASKICDGTEKEYELAINFAPDFKYSLDSIISMGTPGIQTIKGVGNYMKDLLTAHERGKKVALTTYNFSPAVLYAFDVMPICLEGLSALYNAIWKKGIGECLEYTCEVGFTETSCAGQRVALGPILAGLSVQPDFVLCSTAGVCDSNTNSFAFASTYLDIPFYQLNYPPTLASKESTEYHRADFRGVITFLEEHTGKKLDADKLRVICEEIIKQDEITNEIQELQRLVPTPLPELSNLLIYDAKILFNGLKQGTDILESILKLAKENAAKGVPINSSGEERARGFFCYVDHFCADLEWWSWLSKNGISHVGTMVDSFWQADAPYAKGREEEGYIINTTNLETMIDSLADQTSRTPMVKQLRGPYDAPHQWLDDTVGAAKTMKADFLVYLGTMGCRNSWGVVKLLARDTENLGIPTLILYGDAFDTRVESIESLLNKIDEFVNVRGLLK